MAITTQQDADRPEPEENGPEGNGPDGSGPEATRPDQPKPEPEPEPDRLDLARDTTGHVALGHGIHYCLGAPLARLETETALAALVERFPRLALAVPRDALRWRPSIRTRGLLRLPVTF